MIVYDVRVRTHGHDCGLDFYFVEDILFWHFHHSHCPTLVAVFAVECLVHCAHGALAKLLRESIGFVRIFWFKLNFCNLFIELRIREKGIIRNLILLLQSSHDLDHGVWVLFYFIASEIVFLK